MRTFAWSDSKSMPVEGGPIGYGGTKYAYADIIEFIPVPDRAARVAGMQAGDYLSRMDITNDNYEVLKDYPGLVIQSKRRRTGRCSS